MSKVKIKANVKFSGYPIYSDKQLKEQKNEKKK